MTDFTVEVASPPSYAVAPGDDGEYVVTMAEGATYEVAVSGGATTLGGLTDVDTTGVADGDALVYDDATDTWVPGQAGAVDSVNGETGAVVLDAADVPYTGSGYTAVGIPTEPDDVQEALDDLIAVLSPVALGFIGHVGATDPHGDRAYAAGLVDDLSGVTDAATARTNLGLGGAATKNVGTTAGTVAAGDDSRLSDARTPTAHASTHAPGGTDALPWTTIHGRGTAASRPAAAASNAGYIYLATDTGTLSRSNGATWDDLLAAGTGATNYTAGNDSRLSDARTPTTHATSHKSGGSDPIKLNELAAPTAAVALNSQKITGMANGAASGDGATYDQTPASILTTQGDLLYASAANTPARLAKGTAFQVLRTNSGATAPEWVSGGVQLIAETTLNASAANVDFQNIPSGYRHLLVTFGLRSDGATVDDNVTVSLNNDTTDANYDRQYFQSVTSSLTGAAANGASGSRRSPQVPGSSSPANHFGVGFFQINNYTSSVYKVATGRGSCWQQRTTNTILDYTWSIGWANTAAVTRITLAPVTGSNFVASSVVQLYGIG